ncbi:MAG: nitroreductase family protein [Bacteroidetes bacterium]|nr:nitroreductase family protein [Bacteroidota bacterium]
MQSLLTRRSIRKYTSQLIEKDKLNRILRAAMYAPSAVNKQPWHFIVVDDVSLKNKVRELHKNAGMVADAPVSVVVCGDENQAHDRVFWTADCAAATMNILLAAHALGLGAVWCGIYPREQRMTGFAELLNLPGHIKPYSIIPIGYPAEQKTTTERFNANRIHVNSW